MWHRVLKSELDGAYRSAAGLMEMCCGLPLDWKPARENNWMTLGQLLKHISNGAGQPIHGFVTGDWGMDVENMTEEDMLPSAEKMPTVQSVDEARAALDADKEMAVRALEKCTAENLYERPAKAPWDQTEQPLAERIFQMIEHLNIHKAQLFYYLKLQGKPVNTMHMYGMG
ncbi:DinB family protein [bacterium]|nr:DinB family protein [bacterium]